MGFISLQLERRLEQEKYCHGGRKTLWRKKEIYIDCIWKKIPKEGEREGARIKNKDLKSVKPTSWKERGRGRHVLLKQFTTATASSELPYIPFSVCFLQLVAQCLCLCMHPLISPFWASINSSKKWQWNFHPQDSQSRKTPGALPVQWIRSPPLAVVPCSRWPVASAVQWPQCLLPRSCQIIFQQLFCNQQLAVAAAAHPCAVIQCCGFSQGVVLRTHIARQCQPAPGSRGSSWHLDKQEQYQHRGKHPVVCMS